MQGRQMFAVVDQYSALLCSDEEMSCRRGEYRSDRAGLRIQRTDLAETLAIESQQTILRGGYHELRFPAVRQQSRSKSDERRRWQVPAGDELPGGIAIKIVFQKAARPADIEVTLKARRLQEDCGIANKLKAGSQRRSKGMRFEPNLSLRVNLLGGKPKRSLGPPAAETNHQRNQYR